MVRVILGRSAARFLRNAEPVLRSRLLQKLDDLGVDPFPHDAKRILNRQERTFRVRVGDYRILYTLVEHDTILVTGLCVKRPGCVKTPDLV